MEIGNEVAKTFNCSIPFVDVGIPYCRGKDTKRAQDLYKSLMIRELEACPNPCNNMISSFGFPLKSPHKPTLGSASFYFKSIVKVTEDYISYDFLRSSF